MSIIPGGGPTMPPPVVNFEEAIEATARRIQAARDPESAPVSKTAEQAAQIVWEHLHGYLRGRIPYPVPVDLMGVAVSGGLRIAKGITEVGTIFVNQGQYTGQVEYKSWSGFLAIERMTLDRYRRRTA